MPFTLATRVRLDSNRAAPPLPRMAPQAPPLASVLTPKLAEEPTAGLTTVQVPLLRRRKGNGTVADFALRQRARIEAIYGEGRDRIVKGRKRGAVSLTDISDAEFTAVVSVGRVPSLPTQNDSRSDSCSISSGPPLQISSVRTGRMYLPTKRLQLVFFFPPF